jgi:nicotinamidase-related amidase
MITPCIFIDIDTQNDFFDPNGALPIKNASEIRKNLKRLTVQAVKHKIPIVSGVEAYLPKVKKNGPQHCLAGSKGQKKIAETAVAGSFLIKDEKKTLNYAAIIRKHKRIVLEKSDYKFFSNPHTLKILKALKIKNCVVYGIAVDYGIEQVVLKLLEKGFKVWIPADAVKPINEDNREPVMKELRSKGAEMWNTDFIIQNT